MLDINKLKVNDIFYYVHNNYWFFILKVVELPNEQNKNIMCKHLTKKEQYIGKIEPFSVEDLEECFSTYEEAIEFYSSYISKKKESLSDINQLLNDLYNLSKDNIPDADKKLYKEAIETIKIKSL